MKGKTGQTFLFLFSFFFFLSSFFFLSFFLFLFFLLFFLTVRKPAQLRLSRFVCYWWQPFNLMVAGMKWSNRCGDGSVVQVQGRTRSLRGSHSPMAHPKTGLSSQQKSPFCAPGLDKLPQISGRASGRWERSTQQHPGGESREEEKGWVPPAAVCCVLGVAPDRGGCSQSLFPAAHWFSNQTKPAFMFLAKENKTERNNTHKKKV